jgi:hypothetical protein
MRELVTTEQLRYYEEINLTDAHLDYMLSYMIKQDLQNSLGLGLRRVTSLVFEIAVSISEGWLSTVNASFRNKVHIAAKMIREGKWYTPRQMPLPDLVAPSYLYEGESMSGGDSIH